MTTSDLYLEPFEAHPGPGLLTPTPHLPMLAKTGFMVYLEALRQNMLLIFHTDLLL